MADVQLIILGQDPKTDGESATMVLDLDNPNSPLSKFCRRICSGLGIDLYKEVYATNLCKWFFNERPSQIKALKDVDVLALTQPYWLPVLLHEIRQFNQEAIVATLGEPVLKYVTAIPSKGSFCGLKGYWGHVKNWTRKLSFDPAHHSASCEDKTTSWDLTLCHCHI